MVGVVKLIKTTKPEPSVTDIVRDTAESGTARDPAVVAAKQRKAEAEQRFDETGALVEARRLAFTRAEARVRSERLRLADGIGSASEVATAKRDRDAAADELAGQLDVREALGARVADASLAVRTAETQATQRARVELLALAKASVTRLAALFEETGPLVQDCGRILTALEVVYPTKDGFFSRPGWNEAWSWALGGRLLQAFIPDPHAQGGCDWHRWKAACADASFLPAEKVVLSASAKRRQADAKAREAAREAETAEALSHWHSTEHALRNVGE
jgi:hypothetical protein